MARLLRILETLCIQQQKGALSAMMQNMSIELASKGIRVNAVLPGMTETPLIHNDDITQEQLNKDMELYP